MNEHKEFPCCDLLEHLSEYVDDELSPEMMDMIREHAEHCERCRVVINTLSKTIEVCQECTENIHLSGEMHDRLLKKLELGNQ